MCVNETEKQSGLDLSEMCVNEAELYWQSGLDLSWVCVNEAELKSKVD